MKDLRNSKESENGLDLIKILRILNPIKLIKRYYLNMLLFLLIFVIINIIFNPYGVGEFIKNWIYDFKSGLNI